MAESKIIELIQLVLSQQQDSAVRFARMEKSLQSIARVQTKHSRQLADIQTRVDRLETKVEQLDARVEQLDARVEQLDARVEQLSTRVEQLSTRVGRLEAGQGQLERDLHGVIVFVTEYITHNESRTERLENHLGLTPLQSL